MFTNVSMERARVAADWFWETDADGRLTYVSPEAEAAFGLTAAALLGRTHASLATEAPAWAADGRIRTLTYPYAHPDGRLRRVRIACEPRLDTDGRRLGHRGVGTACDEAAADPLEAHAGLIEQNRRFDAALENMSQGLCMFDREQRLVVFNGRYCEIFGLRPGDLRLGMTQREIIALLFSRNCYHPDTTIDGLQASVQAAVQAGGGHDVHRTLADGRIVAVSHRPMAGGGWVATFEDVTHRQESEARIAHLARHDALTDLANRSAIQETAYSLADTVRGRERRLAVFALSLRRFKFVNEGLGIPIGDLLLCEVADRLRALSPGVDTVARVTGDEFMVVGTVGDEAEAFAMGEDLVAGVQAPAAIAGQTVSVGVSLGIALWDGQEPNIGLVIKSADLALDHAKAEGAGTVRLFVPEMDEAARRRRTLERDIAAAFALGHFEVHHQPILSVASRGIVGLEALVRWRHPTRGLISPGVFIPIVEETGLIMPLGEWVLRQACRDAANWPEETSVAVNVSAVQLRQGDFCRVVKAVLAETGLSPHRLELEITESVLLDDSGANLATLHRLRAAGIKISMDDFGTGYSSISYLRRFPFDKIKIDQSFVRDASRNADALAIVQAIIGLGASLGIRTLAEGIETEEQLAIVKAEGCDEMQGFLFSAARPAAEIDALFASGGRATRAA
ncbi:hypothetical protein ASG40_16355 [Methylobacterium sp. Leaf399]|uniref:putative bifunctional diguanylate cyclase/phosphodiesterase n=1 Tax=Methylobacterium sp. Leaf399 TaxID=1736364 RepID=UPI0006FAF8C9|nr:EAL domain-containing protein [Methylobacterium sp. Leaf399]KQT18896.1 hypothetical protein ASG40_16355 [Methylobacterium sp. Leaf399]